MESIARTLAASVKAMVPGRFEVVRATPTTHPHVNWGAHGRVRKTAAALGFRHLGDVDAISVWVDTSITNRPVLSIYVNKDGTEIIGHYRFAPRWTLKGFIARFLGASNDYFDVGTNFGGGSGVSVETTNAALSAVWKSPDFVIRDARPASTSLETLLAAHRERIKRFRAAHPELTPTVVRELNDTITVANAIEQRKLVWRRSFGWATKEEIAAVTKLTGTTLDEVYAAFRKLVGEDTRVAPLAGSVEPAPVAASESAAPAALQFDRVDVGTAAASAGQATIACTSCTRPVTEYFDVDGRHVCASCKEIAARANEPAKGAGVFFKAFLYGGGAAVVGAAIYYGVIAITEFEIGLVALLIGFMVGAAVRTATAGRGGRRYQVMALVMTYFAVGLAYTPLAIKGAMESANSDSTQADSAAIARADSGLVPALTPIEIPKAAISDSASVAIPSGDALTASVDSIADGMTAGKAFLGIGLALVGAFLMAFALPIFAVLTTMPSGLISALIIGVGMHQAWKMTAATVHQISGPYRVGSSPPPAT